MAASASRKTIGPGARILIALKTLFMLGISLSGIFVNVYIWKVSTNISAVGLFNLYQFLAIPVFYTVAGWVTTAKDRKFILRIGVVIHALFYLLVLLLGERTKNYLFALGMLLGAGAGFFYLAQAIISYDLTDDANRDYFTGLLTSSASVVSMLAPFVAGVITSRFTGFTGYSIIFAATFVILFIVTGLSFLLYSRPAGSYFRLEKALFSRNPDWQAILGLTFCEGLRTGTVSFLLGVLIYAATKSEFALGSFTLATSLLTVGSAYLAGRLTGRIKRVKLVLVFAIATTFSYLLLGWKVTLSSIILFGVIQAIFQPLFLIPYQALTFGVIDEDVRAEVRRSEYLVAREIVLGAGRVAGIVLFLKLVGTNLDGSGIQYFMLVLLPVPVVMYGLSRQIRHIPRSSRQ